MHLASTLAVLPNLIVCLAYRLDTELQNVRGALQAQVQDLTAQLAASQQQCAELAAAASAAAQVPSAANNLSEAPKLTGRAPQYSSAVHGALHSANSRVADHKQQRQQQGAPVRTSQRASQGSNASWRDALGLDSDSDVEHPSAAQPTHACSSPHRPVSSQVQQDELRDMGMASQLTLTPHLEPESAGFDKTSQSAAGMDLHSMQLALATHPMHPQGMLRASPAGPMHGGPGGAKGVGQQMGLMAVQQGTVGAAARQRRSSGGGLRDGLIAAAHQEILRLKEVNERLLEAQTESESHH